MDVRSIEPASSFSVLGLGTVVVDHQVRLPTLPEPDTKGEILSDRYQVGGPVPTALALLRGFGVKGEFIGKWGTDRWGDMIEEDLTATGIGIGSAIVSPCVRTGFAHVWVEANTGRRSIAAFRGSHPVVEEELDGIDWDQHDLLHIDGWSTDAAIVAAATMKEKGRGTFLDLGSPKPNWESLLKRVNWVNCPQRLLPQLFPNTSIETAARRLRECGPSEVTVTDGEKGVWYFGPEETFHLPAFAVEAQDTNGAGDVFSGALVFGLLRGWPAQETVRFAAAAAALKCEGLGNRKALPSLSRIQAFLAAANVSVDEP